MWELKHSQNFLRSKKLIDTLIRKSGIISRDTVLEIGAGTGVITERLCKVAKKVIAVEKDRRLYRISKARLKRFKNLELINRDFLHLALPKERYVCFSNIPFNHTADIIRRLFFQRYPPESVYLIMQKEAAERFVGAERSTQMSLHIAPLYSSGIMHVFRKRDFYPTPLVETVFVVFKRKGSADLNYNEYLDFRDFITYCFNRTNTDLKKTLLEILSYRRLRKLQKTLGFSVLCKPSDLEYSQWLNLFKSIRRYQGQGFTSKYRGSCELHYKRHRNQKAKWRGPFYE